MSQIAFSHQFANRWTNAPQQVKAALIQELNDIVTLLDADTDLDSFQFAIADVNAYIDGVYTDLHAEHEAQLEVERLQQEHQAAHSLYRDKDNAPQNATDATESAENVVSSETIDDDDAVVVDDTRLEEPTAEQVEVVEEAHTESELSLEATEEVVTESHDSVEQQASDTPTQSATQNAPAAFAFDSSEGLLDAEFIKELENRIDDYLSEQLANMSEDLKSWMREQIKNRISGNQ